MPRCFYFLLIIFLAAGKVSFAQEIFIKKAITSASTKLFVHFDKNVYTNNEMVWFTAYLLKEKKPAINLHTVLSVALIREIDTTVVLQEKFIMQEGVAFGNILIPNAIQAGNYHFIVFTNRVISGVPEVAFSQAITLKTNNQPTFKADVKLNKKIEKEDKYAEILLSLTSTDNRFLPKPATVNYTIGNFFGKAQTNTTGQLLLKIPLTESINDTLVNIKVKYGSDSTLLNIGLPVLTKKLKVSFFPEGGYLINNLMGNVAFEVKDYFGTPLQLNAILAKDGKPIDTLATNYYGIGIFKLSPQQGSKYTLKLLAEKFEDSTYVLPEIITKGVALSVANAIVADTILLKIRSTTEGLYYLHLHNFNESYSLTPLRLTKLQNYKIPLQNIPKGLFAITITDSLSRPLAERMAFAHYSQKEDISLSTAKTEYKQREKVTLNIKLNESQNEGFFSLACVQEGRINGNNKTDIQSYAYITSELQTVPITANVIVYKDKTFLEHILMVKAWRKYSWLQFAPINATDTLKTYDKLEITGAVTKNNKTLSKAVSLGITLDTTFSIINTDNMGHFTLPNEMLFAENGKKAYGFVNGKSKDVYDISINDPYIFLNQKNRINYWPNYSKIATVANNALATQLDGKAIQLQEVVIKKNRGETSLQAENFNSGPNPCGDYVCKYGILNCPNHHWGKAPVKGESYGIINKWGTSSIIYRGCYALANKEKSALKPIPVIYTNKEFYVDDYKKENEEAYFTTLYWQHGVLINAENKKEIELSFYTSDVKGKFRIVLQGVGDKNLLYSEHFFNVK